jgi:hypothetical protein
MVWYGSLAMVNMNFWVAHLASNVVADFNGLELMTWLMVLVIVGCRVL